jgi:hypothetical protein
MADSCAHITLSQRNLCCACSQKTGLILLASCWPCPHQITTTTPPPPQDVPSSNPLECIEDSFSGQGDSQGRNTSRQQLGVTGNVGG